MAIKFLQLVLKKYKIVFENVWEPWFKLFDISCFCFFSCKFITLLVFQEKSRFIGNGSVSRFHEMFEAKNVFLVQKKLKNRVVKHQPNPLQGYGART